MIIKKLANIKHEYKSPQQLVDNVTRNKRSISTKARGLLLFFITNFPSRLPKRQHKAAQMNEFSSNKAIYKKHTMRIIETL